MPWLLMSPGHQQPWYWLYRICRSFFYLRKCFKYLCQINVELWHKMQIYVYVPSEKFSTFRVNVRLSFMWDKIKDDVCWINIQYQPNKQVSVLLVRLSIGEVRLYFIENSHLWDIYTCSRGYIVSVYVLAALVIVGSLSISRHNITQYWLIQWYLSNEIGKVFLKTDKLCHLRGVYYKIMNIFPVSC